MKEKMGVEYTYNSMLMLVEVRRAGQLLGIIFDKHTMANNNRNSKFYFI